MNPAQDSSRSINAGTMLINEGLLLPKLLEVDTNACSPRLRSVGVLDSLSLERKLNAVGWHLCFLADHVTAIAFDPAEGRAANRRKSVGARMAAIPLTWPRAVWERMKSEIHRQS